MRMKWICRLFGHWWKRGKVVDGVTDEWFASYRSCRICGLYEEALREGYQYNDTHEEQMTPEERARLSLTRVGVRKPMDEAVSSVADEIREARAEGFAEAQAELGKWKNALQTSEAINRKLMQDRAALEAKIRTLEAALRPFAECMSYLQLTQDAFNNARAALAGKDRE